MTNVPSVVLRMSPPEMTTNDDDYEYPQVIACQGPPLCELELHEAVAHQEQGCKFCKIEELQPDGLWIITQDPTMKPQ